MAGQIAHNFDEEDGWMIPAPLRGEMKFRIHTSRKGIIKKKKKKIPDAEFTSCHKTGKDSGEGLRMQRDPSVSSACLSEKHLPRPRLDQTVCFQTIPVRARQPRHLQL